MRKFVFAMVAAMCAAFPAYAQTWHRVDPEKLAYWEECEMRKQGDGFYIPFAYYPKEGTMYVTFRYRSENYGRFLRYIRENDGGFIAKYSGDAKVKVSLDGGEPKETEVFMMLNSEDGSGEISALDDFFVCVFRLEVPALKLVKAREISISFYDPLIKSDRFLNCPLKGFGAALNGKGGGR